jgi:hypothetical protein
VLSLEIQEGKTRGGEWLQFWLFLSSHLICTILVVSEQLFLPTYLVVVVSEHLLFPHVQFLLFLSSSGYRMCNCSCFWAVVYSSSCFWIALLSICTICVCFWGNLCIVYIIVVVSKQFFLPCVQLSPTFTVISPQGNSYCITTQTQHTTLLPPPAYKTISFVTIPSKPYRKFYCKIYSFITKQLKVYYYICASSIEHGICFWK